MCLKRFVWACGLSVDGRYKSNICVQSPLLDFIYLFIRNIIFPLPLRIFQQENYNKKTQNYYQIYEKQNVAFTVWKTTKIDTKTENW